MNFDSSVLNVAIEDIVPNRFQPRLAFDDDSLTELATSIKEHGIIQPLVLRRLGDKYEIIAGERRYRAAMKAGLTSVPAVISQIDDQKSAEVALAENVQRTELTAIEEAKSYKALLDAGYMSQEQLAKKLGLSISSIINKLKLLNLATEVQNAVLDHKISERHARSLLVIEDKEEQIKWLNKIIDERLTVKMLDDMLKKEYNLTSVNTVNVEEVKQKSVDIEIPKVETQNNNEMSKDFVLGSFDLGAKPTNKFFNALEDEAVNMSMNENINPFNMPSNASLISNTPKVEEPKVEMPKPEVQEPTPQSIGDNEVSFTNFFNNLTDDLNNKLQESKVEEIETLDFEPPVDNSSSNIDLL